MDADAINMIFGIIGTIGTILGIVGIILTVKSVRKKGPVYSIKSNNLISGSASTLENLNIAYKKRKVQNLTVTKILFYNRGAETITKQDLETINRLRISSETCRVLDGSLLQANNISNNLSVSYDKDGNNVFVDFDYLDKNQGEVIQVVHTGLSSENIGLYGDIKGVQKLIEVQPRLFKKSMKLQDLSFSHKALVGAGLASIFPLISFAVAVILQNQSQPISNESMTSFQKLNRNVFVIFTMFFLSISGILYSLQALFIQIRNIPSGLEKFFD